MPGWKRHVGKRLEEIIVRIVPDVHKAVTWNDPFYGHEGDGLEEDQLVSWIEQPATCPARRCDGISQPS
jgi:hypothetical protein